MLEMPSPISVVHDDSCEAAHLEVAPSPPPSPLTPLPAGSPAPCALLTLPRGCAAATGQLGLDVEIPGSLTVGGTEVKVDDTVLYSVREDGLFDTLSGTGFAMTDMPGCGRTRLTQDVWAAGI